MNNRVQQRFDRSIKQAMEETKSREDREKAERANKVLQARKEKAQRLILEVSKTLETGQLRGRVISKEERKILKGLLKDYTRILELDESPLP